jgi:hypothetical protein
MAKVSGKRSSCPTGGDTGHLDPTRSMAYLTPPMDSPVLWVRVDSSASWLAPIPIEVDPEAWQRLSRPEERYQKMRATHQQLECMWIRQLQHDRELGAQLEAVRRLTDLAHWTSASTSTVTSAPRPPVGMICRRPPRLAVEVLIATVHDEKLFHAVRVAAADALAAASGSPFKDVTDGAEKSDAEGGGGGDGDGQRSSPAGGGGDGGQRIGPAGGGDGDIENESAWTAPPTGSEKSAVSIATLMVAAYRDRWYFGGSRVAPTLTAPASEQASEQASQPASEAALREKQPSGRSSPLARKAALRGEAAPRPAQQPFGAKRPHGQQSVPLGRIGPAASKASPRGASVTNSSTLGNVGASIAVKPRKKSKSVGNVGQRAKQPHGRSRPAGDDDGGGGGSARNNRKPRPKKPAGGSRKSTAPVPMPPSVLSALLSPPPPVGPIRWSPLAPSSLSLTWNTRAPLPPPPLPPPTPPPPMPMPTPTTTGPLRWPTTSIVAPPLPVHAPPPPPPPPVLPRRKSAKIATPRSHAAPPDMSTSLDGQPRFSTATDPLPPSPPAPLSVISDPGLRRFPMPHRFRDFADYRVKIGLLSAIAATRDRRGNTPAAAIDLVLHTLAHHDNAGNTHSDLGYLERVLTAIGGMRFAAVGDTDEKDEKDAVAADRADDLGEEVLTSGKGGDGGGGGGDGDGSDGGREKKPATDVDDGGQRVWAELLRWLDRDELVPSHEHRVTCAVLSAASRLNVPQNRMRPSGRRASEAAPWAKQPHGRSGRTDAVSLSREPTTRTRKIAYRRYLAPTHDARVRVTACRVVARRLARADDGQRSSPTGGDSDADEKVGLERQLDVGALLTALETAAAVPDVGPIGSVRRLDPPTSFVSCGTLAQTWTDVFREHRASLDRYRDPSSPFVAAFQHRVARLLATLDRAGDVAAALAVAQLTETLWGRTAVLLATDDDDGDDEKRNGDAEVAEVDEIGGGGGGGGGGGTHGGGDKEGAHDPGRARAGKNTERRRRAEADLERRRRARQLDATADRT